MTKVKTIAIQRQSVLKWAQLSVLISLSILAPLLKTQSLTGSLVNATLFLATALLGTRQGILVGLLPSLISLSIGLLPMILFPMIPFIIISNIILVLIFDYLRKKNYWLGVVSASFIKFLFLFLTSSFVISLFVENQIAMKFSSMMGIPQFFTAITGGLIASIVLRAFKKRDREETILIE